MHLVRGMTTIHYPKCKRHITKSQLERWEKERRIYNKDMKRLGMHGRNDYGRIYLYVLFAIKIPTYPVIQTPASIE